MSDKQPKLAYLNQVKDAKLMKKDGKSVAEIAEAMGISENHVRNLLFDFPVVPRMQIDGPYAHKGVYGMEVPVFIFEPGAVRKDIGKVTIKKGEGPDWFGMIFEVELDEEYQDVKHAGFEVPMRYHIQQNVKPPEEPSR